MRTKPIRLSLSAGPAGAGIRLAVALMLAAADAALAHHASSSWTYPPACCLGDADGGDCQRISRRTVFARPDGWIVELKPGDHRKVTRPHRYFVPQGEEIPSRDGEYHICLHPTEDDENCFFAPPDAM